MKNKNGISLVLSGGGARGLAHIGVLKTIDRLGIPITSICGCSMGGLIASLFALGFPIKEIEQIALKYSSMREMVKLVDLNPRRKGLIVGQRYRAFLSKIISEEKSLENTLIPLYMNTVDLTTGSEVILEKGNLLDAILATTAVPGVFTPLEGNNRILADGGILNNLPISIMQSRTENPIVAVDVHQVFTESQPIVGLQNPFSFSLFPEFIREYYLAELIRVRKMTDLHLEKSPPDLLIQPSIDPNISLFFGFQKVKELIAAGEKAAQSAESDFLSLLK
jgi:NTE family protein